MTTLFLTLYPSPLQFVSSVKAANSVCPVPLLNLPCLEESWHGVVVCNGHLYISMYVFIYIGIYYKELVHIITEAGKFQDP